MKTSLKLILPALAITLFFLQNVLADFSETAQVIREDKNTNDLIVKRSNGQKWLIEHTPACNSASTEFPVTLIVSGDKIVQVKISSNAICKVLNAVSYGGEGIFIDIIRSQNQLVPDHEAIIVWGNKKYQIDYGKGCPYLYDYANKKIYYSFPEGSAKGGILVLPGFGGQCPFTFTKVLEVLPSENLTTLPALEGLVYQAQNNQVYFYWEPVKAEGKWLYAISYSKYELDLDTYKSWREMPNIKIIKSNSYIVHNLANRRQYYFYIAVINETDMTGPWSQVTATPVAGEKLINNPDSDPFQIELKETDTEFQLSWPKRDDARRYYVRFFANGRQEFFKILRPENNYFTILKDPKYLNKGLRLEVKTIPLPNKPHFSDGIYWKYEIKK